MTLGLKLKMASTCGAMALAMALGNPAYSQTVLPWLSPDVIAEMTAARDEAARDASAAEALLDDADAVVRHEADAGEEDERGDDGEDEH